MNAKISVFTIFASFALLFAGCSKDDENVPGVLNLLKLSWTLSRPNIRMPATQNGQSMTIIM